MVRLALLSVGHASVLTALACHNAVYRSLPWLVLVTQQAYNAVWASVILLALDLLKETLAMCRRRKSRRW